MKKLSILLVCCLLVGCSNKVEQSTTSIEETMHPTTIIETNTETTEQITVYSLYDNTLVYVEESVDSQVIDTLAKGEAVTLMASNDNFAKVKKENGLLGYVPREMLSETDPTVISATSVPTSETAVNEDIIRLESEVSELESKVSELENRLEETSVETIVETTKDTKQPKETIVVVVTATPTPTKEPTEPTQTPTQTEPSEIKGEHICYCDSVTISISSLKIDNSNNFIQNILEELSKHVHHNNCNSPLQVDSSTIPGVGCQLALGSYQVKWYGECGTYYQTVTITE